MRNRPAVGYHCGMGERVVVVPLGVIAVVVLVVWLWWRRRPPEVVDGAVVGIDLEGQ